MSVTDTITFQTVQAVTVGLQRSQRAVDH